MANSLLIFTEEGVKRVIAGLAELPGKISHELLNDIEAQLGWIKNDIKKYVALVEEHFAPHKALAETQTIKDAADKVLADVTAAV